MKFDTFLFFYGIVGLLASSLLTGRCYASYYFFFPVVIGIVLILRLFFKYALGASGTIKQFFTEFIIILFTFGMPSVVYELSEMFSLAMAFYFAYTRLFAKYRVNTCNE